MTLERLLNLLEAITREPLIWHCWSPIALSQLVRACSDQPVDRPLTDNRISSLLDSYWTLDGSTPLNSEDLRLELDVLLSAADPDDRTAIDRMRQFANSNKLRIAGSRYHRHYPLMVVSDYSTDIAETLLQKVLKQTWNDLYSKHMEFPRILGRATRVLQLSDTVNWGYRTGLRSGSGSWFFCTEAGVQMAVTSESACFNDVFYVDWANE